MEGQLDHDILVASESLTDLLASFLFKNSLL